eukprot:CAMPEP_0178920408 /NCGR_PEP_ID=MMETSP0786-20121207/14989_1 /TAXON_ID=186022 /ORGANISM="Thalassionema frauenfeldii, Strain CCMP 1798" /LENGTH=190 /DNA_ID=CAMNT_0020594473 /DNA_START=30 /DNA_END=602 /DNA_ORIENTATION=-
MPSSTSMQQQHDSDADQIRARLLHRLGIHNEEFVSRSTPVTTAAEQRRLRILREKGLGHSISMVNPPDGSAARIPLDGVVPHLEPLKGRPAFAKSLAPSLAPPRRQGSRHVIFNDDVSVVDIPMRNEYSKRVQSCMWNSLSDLQKNAQRNTEEFAAEGWNWETVLEDDGMYIDASSGELVHPVHCEQHEQ